jgi:hypothetical protein
VAAAISGRYPPDDPAAPGYPPEDPQESGQDFWLVRPMYFTTRHVADDGTEHRDCCAAYPAGLTVHRVLGAEARAALRNILA